MKNFKTDFENLVINNIDLSGYDVEQDGMTEQEQITFVLNCFKDEFEYKNNIVRYPNRINRCSEWLRGLPSVLTVPFYNIEIDDFLLKIGMINENSSDNVLIEKREKYWLMCAKSLLNFK